jgi:hypothetical protein
MIMEMLDVLYRWAVIDAMHLVTLLKQASDEKRPDESGIADHRTHLQRS